MNDEAETGSLFLPGCCRSQPNLPVLPTRPNGPAEPSPGMRPQADSLGEIAIHHRGLKGRERFLAGVGSALGSGSRGPSGRGDCGAR